MIKREVLRKQHIFMRQLSKQDHHVNNLPRCLAIDFLNACNYKCEFCYEREDETYSNIKLDLDLVKRMCDEAHELGIWEIVLQGGELLIFKDYLFDALKAIGTERFRVVLITNGSILTKEYAEELLAAGVDCVGISISSLNPEEHDKSRRVIGAYDSAIRALDSAKNAGLTVWTQTIFGHHNAFSDELVELLEFNKKNGYGCYFLLAMPYGDYEGSFIDGNDLKRLQFLREKYSVWLDQWDLFDPEKKRISGCIAVNRAFITPLGDVLPCPFINTKLGNLREQSLKDILDYGFSIKYFGEYSPVCLAAQNKKFREKFLSEKTDMFRAPLAKDLFKSDDYIEKEKEKTENE